jgi:hypothetical protein
LILSLFGFLWQKVVISILHSIYNPVNQDKKEEKRNFNAFFRLFKKKNQTFAFGI